MKDVDVNSREFRAKLELEDTGEITLKVTEELISKLRALAKQQKAESSAEKFAEILGNGGKDTPEAFVEEAKINSIADTLEIEEE